MAESQFTTGINGNQTIHIDTGDQNAAIHMFVEMLATHEQNMTDKILKYLDGLVDRVAQTGITIQQMEYNHRLQIATSNVELANLQIKQAEIQLKIEQTKLEAEKARNQANEKSKF